MNNTAMVMQLRFCNDGTSTLDPIKARSLVVGIGCFEMRIYRVVQ